MKLYWQITIPQSHTIYCTGTSKQADEYCREKGWLLSTLVERKEISRDLIPSDEEVFDLKDLTKRDAHVGRVFRAYPEKDG